VPFQVIGGTARGRRLKSPPAGVRPTAAILRRSLFDILGPDVFEARVLDLFAGAGSLGVEALSRGASACDFVERDPRCAAVIRSNLELIKESQGVARSRVDCAPVEAWLMRPQTDLGAYDLVMLDPPYGDPGLEKVLTLLARPGGLKASALLVLEERADRVVEPPDGLRVVRRVAHGDSSLTLMRPSP
jgi:16S rRNA (guanine966-N2)-methyltransferase